MACSVWNVIALHTPHVLRRCARCDQRRAFVSSDRFRVNAHKQRLDVWLIYRCEACDESWNLPVHERISPRAVGASALDRYHANDRRAAWQVAFDRARLAALGVEAVFETAYRVDREPELTPEIRLRLVHPCRIRLDRLLATELGVARSAVPGLAVDLRRRDLRRPARDGQRVTLALSAPAPASALPIASCTSGVPAHQDRSRNP